MIVSGQDKNTFVGPCIVLHLSWDVCGRSVVFELLKMFFNQSGVFGQSGLVGQWRSTVGQLESGCGRSILIGRLQSGSIRLIAVGCKSVYCRRSVGFGDRPVSIRSSVIGRRLVGGGDRSVGIRSSVWRRSVRGGDRTVGNQSSVAVSVGWWFHLRLVCCTRASAVVFFFLWYFHLRSENGWSVFT